MNEPFANPAGRLHNILSRYSEASSGVRPVDAWQTALDLHAASEVQPCLAQLAGQVPALRAALAVHAPNQVANFDVYADDIYAPIMATSVPLFSSSAGKKVSSHALMWLDTASDLLSHRMPDRHLPSPDEKESLRDHFARARQAVLDEGEATPELRFHLLGLVDQAVAALDRVDILGPEAVMAAADQVVVAGARLPEGSTAKGPLREAVMEVWRVIEVTVVASEFTQLAAALAGQLPPGGS